MLGTWAVSGDATTSIPVLAGMKTVAGNGVNILYAKGANITDDTLLAKKVNVFGERVSRDSLAPDQLLAQAVETATRADVIVAVVGEASEMSGEAASRSDITLPESQRKLLQALAQTGKPLVVVLMSGRPLILNQENELATSLLHVWFQGHEAGNAIADVLFGNYNPSGKLSMTFPQNIGQIPIYYNHKNTGRPQAQGQPAQKFRSNYLDVSNDPLFPFGYGLSYTTFSYREVQLNKASMKPNENLQVKVQVSNTGKFDGEEVVQLYLRDIYASVVQPVKKLKAFQKVMLKAGETRDVTFNLAVEDLKFFNSDLKWTSEPGEFKVMVGGNSRDVKEATFTLTK
jgi:beta-glucosidase